MQEEDRGEEDSIEAVMAEARLTVHEPRVKVDLTKYVEHHAFAFDDVLDENVSNDAVYRSTVQPLVATIFRAGKVGLLCSKSCQLRAAMAGIGTLGAAHDGS
jgi:kinesin family protein 2/24